MQAAVHMASRTQSQKEAARRELLRRRGPISGCFAVQRDAINDASSLRAWQTDRRAGKTTACMTEFFQEGRTRESEYAYIALTRKSAKRIAWGMAKKINRMYSCGALFLEQELRIVLPSGSACTIYGADRPHWTDLLFGQKLRRVYIDEAAFFSIDLRHFIYDVLDPCVADERGTITMVSRPGHVNAGFFYDVMHGKEGGWSARRWSWRDNTYARDAIEERLAKRIAENPDYANSPSYRRNWCGEWVSELGERVYHYADEVNGLHEDFETKEGDEYILGLDLGWHDATAFVLVTWSKRHDKVVILDSFSQPEMLLDKVAARVRAYIHEYPGLLIVGDPGRRDAFEELRQRYDLPIFAADKSDKRYWIDQINNDLSAGKIQVEHPEQSKLVEEWMDLVWEHRRHRRMIESPGRANDCADSFLYAYRKCWHFTHTDQSEAPKPGTKEYWQIEEEQIEREQEELHRLRDEGPWKRKRR